MRKAMAILAAVGTMLAGGTAWGQEKLAYEDLVKRLTDLEYLATLPSPGEKCMQQSSYDRASKYDDSTGKYINWGANGDGGGIIRREGDLSVFAEIEGPGVIWRIWSAKADNGRVKVFLDGAETPAIDLPFRQYFDCSTKPFVYPSLVHDAASGKNCYVPIPFQKSCKVVAEKGWGQYYHFTYSVLPEGTEVPTFRMQLTEAQQQALEAAQAVLGAKLGEDPAGRRDGQAEDRRTVAVPPGKAETVAKVAGPRAITALRARMDLADRQDQMAALRELVLRITWDDEAPAAVWAPLGDFFGSAPGVNEYKSLPLGMTKDGFYCLWYMPFARSALVEIVNDGAKERKVEFQVTHAPLSRPIEKLARFHAKWHRDAFLPPEKERAIDWTILKTAGRGRFCGVMLHVWNPKGSWWGEGDEKFHIDGEKFPSTFGTGSEDYFGYAWCNPTLFQNAFHNQTISMGNRGHVSVNRWHITDNVPFQTAFEGYIEKYFSNSRPTLYAAVAYWYQAPGGTDAYEPVPVDQRWGYCVVPETVGVKGAMEGENMKVLQRTGGELQHQDMDTWGADKWSGGVHLWWIRGKPGDKLTLALPVAKAGRYQLQAALTRARDYGIVQLHLDDRKLGEPIDLFDANVVPTGPLPLGTHDLTAGEHRLTIEIVGANDKAIKSYMCGLDYVLLKPAE